MWLLPFLIVINSCYQCLGQENSLKIPIPKSQNSISGINFVYILSSSPNLYQENGIEEVADNNVEEFEQMAKLNPFLSRLFAPRNEEEKDAVVNQNIRHSHNKLRLFRRRRSADPSYKKGYGATYGGGYGGGGGGCCSTCGNCGGGCSGGGCGGGGGGGSGSYSSSQSSSSSSSGSYSSGYGKKK